MDSHIPSPFSEQKTRLVNMDPAIEFNAVTRPRYVVEEGVEFRKIRRMITSSNGRAARRERASSNS